MEMFFFQYSKLDSVYKFITIVIYVAMALVEVTRLYLGYAGNLQEKVFWEALVLMGVDSRLVQSLKSSLVFRQAAFHFACLGQLHAYLRGCSYDTCTTFIPVQDEKLILCFPKPFSLGYEFYTAVKRNVKQTVISWVILHLHDTGMTFHTRMKILLRYRNRGELAPVWDFLVVSFKQIQSREREPVWTHVGTKVAQYHVKNSLGYLAFCLWDK